MRQKHREAQPSSCSASKRKSEDWEVLDGKTQVVFLTTFNFTTKGKEYIFGKGGNGKEVDKYLQAYKKRLQRKLLWDKYVVGVVNIIRRNRFTQY
jgi:hypothetical protein